MAFFARMYNQGKAILTRLIELYQNAVDRACMLPYPLRILIGALLIIFGIVSIPNPLINGWVMIV